MDKLYVLLGVPSVLLGIFVSYITMLGLKDNLSILNIAAHLFNYLMIIGFLGAGVFLIITGLRKTPAPNVPS